MENLKFNLLNAMSMLSQLESNQFKSRAYKSAYWTLSKVSEEDLSQKASFTYLPGIGKGISDKIIEYRTSGRIGKLVALMAEKVTELPEKDYKVRKGYISKRIPLAYADKIATSLGIEETDYVSFVGSYRRRVNSIADLDLLAFDEVTYWDIVGMLSENPNLTLLVSGGEKSSFRYNNPENTQIDVNNGSHGNKWTQLLHHTGSKESNIRLRGIAKSKGWSLNQYGLNGYNGDINSEEDIFTALGVPYVSPENR